eukprot:NODE_3878_length_901_cov_7.725352_g3571_i0.p1 GENE.NODE_3878_length_901_cov_7.725352_g3571_i0~~NODE_3878_length_901_cov_7.725352_g3571_i0.p1  ORF type:complete len:221 (-),score=56.93 NODE_3878_length_901_cov_7.725352_g3571_i0:95-757(-)
MGKRENKEKWKFGFGEAAANVVPKLTVVNLKEHVASEISSKTLGFPIKGSLTVFRLNSLCLITCDECVRTAKGDAKIEMKKGRLLRTVAVDPDTRAFLCMGCVNRMHEPVEMRRQPVLKGPDVGTPSAGQGGKKSKLHSDRLPGLAKAAEKKQSATAGKKEVKAVKKPLAKLQNGQRNTVKNIDHRVIDAGAQKRIQQLHGDAKARRQKAVMERRMQSVQ